MCVVAVKYFSNIGWVGVKNRDRNYDTKLKIVQSNRKNVQRLYIDDEYTRWTEGLNEYGLCILSATFSVKSDEKEGDEIANFTKKRKEGYMSPDGKKIRDALFLKDPLDAIEYLQYQELAGATYVFNQKDCYLLEGGFTEKKIFNRNRRYISKIQKIENYSCRTNHGILLPQLGYKKDAADPKLLKSRKSSEKRLEAVKDSVSAANTYTKMMNALSVKPYDDPFLNPIRVGDIKKGDMVTTGQIMLIPNTNTMHYRPIYSTITANYHKLNSTISKTYFEIVSDRRLLSFKDYNDIKN